MKIRLDNRLSAVAGMIRRGSVFADIGSDHAYLACALVLRGVCLKAYACDINTGPLSRAGDTIKKYGLTDRVEAILSDGLSALRDVRVDDIAIAGMGGELITRIIGDAPWAALEDIRFILQPMTKAEYLREWLYASGFEIEAEAAAIDGRFVYPVMRVKYTGKSRKIPMLFAWTGKIWDNTDDASQHYLCRMHAKARKIARARNDEEYIRLMRMLEEKIR